MAKLPLMFAQLNLTVGAIEDNCDKVLAAAAEADRGQSRSAGLLRAGADRLPAGGICCCAPIR